MAPTLALSGFMGAGKSSVGALVAARLGWRYVDLDEEFERLHPGGIAEFFAEHGETAFRVEECRLLQAVLESGQCEPGLVLALGGGTLESPEAAALLGRQAGVVYLQVDLSTAWDRSRGTGRPLAQDQEQFARLLERRRERYEETADWLVPVADKTLEQLAEEIVEIVRLADSAWPSLWGRRLSATQRSSLIVGGEGALSAAQKAAERTFLSGRRLFVITDRVVYAAWGGRIAGLLGEGQAPPVLVVDPGERTKGVEWLVRCWEWLAAQKARRDEVVVAFGGGVVGDLAGFTAATYQRGVPLWQIPTTLLAQVDSSVGGKTAINLDAGKNLVGAFYQPDLVFVDPVLLTTLPDEVYVSGLAEVIKCALLSSQSFFAFLEKQQEKIRKRDPAVLATVVKRCVMYKAKVVEEDERDQGMRAVLNLGHTTAHALEATLGYGALSHGQAVALGLLVALRVSERLLGLDPQVRERTRSLLESFSLPTCVQLPDLDRLLQAASRDKKVRTGGSGFVGLVDIGSPVYGLDVSPELLAEGLEVIAL